MHQHNDQLFTVISYSYSEYIQAQIDLLNNSLYFSTIYFDEETFHLQESLKEIFLSLPTLLSAGSSSKEACATELLDYRATLEQKFRCLIAYQRELTHIVTLKQQAFSLTKDYLEELGLTDIDSTQIDYEKLALDCTHYVFNENKETSIQKKASELLPYIPIKLTKDNYLAYCKKSITHIAIQDTPEAASHLVSILKQLFDGTDCPQYGQHFSDLVESLDNLAILNDLTDLFEEANLLNETIETLIDMLHHMHKTICTLSNLLLFDQLDFTDITDMHVSFSDLYYSLKSVFLKESESEVLLPTLKERLENLTKELKQEMQKVSTTAQVNPFFNLMQSYLSMSIDQIFGFTTVKKSNYSTDVSMIIEVFINDLRSKLFALPTLERKCRMQYFISNIPFVMSHDNLNTYIQKAFTHLKTPEQGVLTAMQLSSILEQAGYFPAIKEQPIIEEDLEDDDAATRFLAEHGE